MASEELQAYRRLSPWLESLEGVAPRLAESRDVDVVVIGAGFAGLSTALELAERGLAVAVLESHVAGYGASGRNAGHLTPTIGKDIPTLLRMTERSRVEALVRLVEESISHVESLIDRRSIDCAYEPVGNIIAAVHPRQYRAIDRAAEAAEALGLPGAVLEPADMRRRGVPASFLRGYHESHGGILDPGRFVRGLRRAALDAGVALFERSPVQQLVPERRIVARTAAGEVRADSVVLATNAYMSGMELPKAIASALLPIYVQLFRTEPLGQEQLRRVDWHGREGIYTAHEILESFRLDADNAIVGGSKYIRYGYGGGFLPDRDSSVALRLEGLFRRRFPELADVRVTRHWGGRIGMALDFLPVVGRTGPADNIYYAMGWAGHGVATATFAGRMIAALMHGERGPGDVLVDRRFWSLPPEPLRWFVFQALSRFFSAVDRRADRELG